MDIPNIRILFPNDQHARVVFALGFVSALHRWERFFGERINLLNSDELALIRTDIQVVDTILRDFLDAYSHSQGTAKEYSCD